MRARIAAHLFDPETRKWWTLAAVSFGLFMIMLDNTVVNVALPSIQRSLNAGQSELEWVVVSYALTFATFMLTGGKLADYFGRAAAVHHRPRVVHRRVARLRARSGRATSSSARAPRRESARRS